MKPLLYVLLLISPFITLNAQNVGVGTTTPDESAQLDVSSTERGFLPPRMTAAQRNFIPAPVAGLIIWCSDCGDNGELQIYNGNGWKALTLGSIPFQNIQIGNDLNGGPNHDKFGHSVSLSSDGNRLAVGAPGFGSGFVRIFEWNGVNWTQIGSDIDSEYNSDMIGSSISLSSDGNRVAIGAIGAYFSKGSTHIFEWNGNSWLQLGSDIVGEVPGDQSGWATSLSSDGNIVAVGALYNDGINGASSGHVRVFEWDNTNWVQKGIDIDGEAAGDNSGRSVSLSSDGTIVAIGAPNNYGINGNGSGHVRIFEWNNTNWTQIGSDIDGEAFGDWSGYSVSLSSEGNIVAIGAVGPSNDTTAGNYVRIFEWDNTNWVQNGIDIDGEAGLDAFGRSVSLSADGNIVAIGANGNDDNGTNSGHVRIFEWNGDSWVQKGVDIDGETALEQSGRSVSLSSDGSRVAIGAPFNQDNGTNSGQVRVYH